MTSTLRRPMGPRSLRLGLVFVLCMASAAIARDGPVRRLYPVGGGYEEALKGYSVEVSRTAAGPSVRMVMVPAAFADDPVLPEDPVILAEDVEALRLACEAVIDRIAFPSGCDVTSVPLYVAADAYDPAILARLADPTVHGIFFTGGDQGYAARILAGTPAEATLATAAERGVVFGGTSAGAAIQSLAMNAGYTDAGDSTNALQKGSIDLWLGRPPEHRGLVFGSRRMVIDEHLHSRGRLGRMVNAAAQTADTFGNGGLLGLGFDYDTGAVITGDRWISSIQGVSSGVVVDLRTARARHAWVGPNAALSARRVLTHVLPPGRQVAFDLVRREPWWRGRPVPFDEPRGAPGLRSGHDATLVLGGDVSEDLGGPVIREFVRQASRQRLGKVVVVAAGYASPADAQAAADLYARALVAAGWAGTTSIHLHGQTRLDPARAKDASGVLLLGGDQSLMGAVLADRAFTDWIRTAARSANVVMFERAMAAAAGEHFDAIGEGDTADDAIAAFQSGNAVVRPGLGLLRGAFEPRLQVDKRWGRLYGVGAQRRHTPVFGISESTALVVRGPHARVVGAHPVVVLDGRNATFFEGSNGAFGALNVLLDVYEPGDTLSP